MSSNSIIMVIIALAALILFAFLFWFADRISRTKVKIVKEEKSEIKGDAGVAVGGNAPQSDQAPIKTSTNNLADELDVLVKQSAVEEKKEREERAKNFRMMSNNVVRIHDYYEKKWKKETRDSSILSPTDPYGSGDYDDDDVTVTPEDMQKLVVLKDLFDKKS